MDEDLCRVWGEEDGRSEMIDVLCVGGEIFENLDQATPGKPSPMPTVGGKRGTDSLQF